MMLWPSPGHSEEKEVVMIKNNIAIALSLAAALAAPIAGACEKTLAFPVRQTDNVTCKDVVNGVTVASGDRYEGILKTGQTKEYRLSARLVTGALAFTILRDSALRQVTNCYVEDSSPSPNTTSGSTSCTSTSANQVAKVSVYVVKNP
jgi:hypothetical protein